MNACGPERRAAPATGREEKKGEGQDMGLTAGQKSDRVVRFMRGLLRPGVAHALAAYGFTQADWDEGWRLLQTSVGEWMARPQPMKRADPTIVQQLDAWENHWFPIAQATLRRRKPAVADQLFLNLAQTSGVGVIITVSTFVRRVRQLETDGPDGQEALALLRARGLTDDVLADAEALLKRFGDLKLNAVVIPEPEAAVARREQAEKALWSWYREWSTIARNAVTDGNLLRGLGFGTTGGDPGAEEEPDAEDTPADQRPGERREPIAHRPPRRRAPSKRPAAARRAPSTTAGGSAASPRSGSRAAAGTFDGSGRVDHSGAARVGVAITQSAHPRSLVTLVDAHETGHHPIDPPDPIDAIELRMAQMGLGRADLQPLIGKRARVSDVLNRRRRLTITMITKLRDKLGIPADVLIGPRRPVQRKSDRSEKRPYSSASDAAGAVRHSGSQLPPFGRLVT
jgi:antitoxin component HigA of HigAB toxin-antitoxin module